VAGDRRVSVGCKEKDSRAKEGEEKKTARMRGVGIKTHGEMTLLSYTRRRERMTQ